MESEPHTQAQNSLFGPDHLDHDLQAISFKKKAVGKASYIPPSPIQFHAQMQQVIILGLVPSDK